MIHLSLGVVSVPVAIVVVATIGVTYGVVVYVAAVCMDVVSVAVVIGVGADTYVLICV